MKTIIDGIKRKNRIRIRSKGLRIDKGKILE